MAIRSLLTGGDQADMLTIAKVGIYLTQVAPICSMAGCGGLPAESERVRGPV